MVLTLPAWADLLVRGVVLIQIAGTLTILAFHHYLLIPKLRKINRRAARIDGLTIVILLFGYGGVLNAFGLPSGLVVFWAQLVGLWILIRLSLHTLRRWASPKLVARISTRIIRPTFILFIATAIIIQLFPLSELLQVKLFTLFNQPFTIFNLLLCIVVPYYLVVLSPYPVVLAGYVLQKTLNLSESTRSAVTLILRYVLIGFGVLWLLSGIGITGAGLAAIVGGLSIGVGFGVRELIANFVSGLWLLFEGSVRPGDILFMDGDPCKVRSLGLRASVLWRQRDNAELVVPNQIFFTTTTTTYTGSDVLRRGELIVSAAYCHRPVDVCNLLLECTQEVEQIMDDPGPSVFVYEYSSSSIDYAIRYYIANPMDNLSTRSNLSAQVWDCFSRNEIEIPFPQRVIHSAIRQPDYQNHWKESSS